MWAKRKEKCPSDFPGSLSVHKQQISRSDLKGLVGIQEFLDSIGEDGVTGKVGFKFSRSSFCRPLYCLLLCPWACYTLLYFVLFLFVTTQLEREKPTSKSFFNMLVSVCLHWTYKTFNMYNEKYLKHWTTLNILLIICVYMHVWYGGGTAHMSWPMYGRQDNFVVSVLTFRLCFCSWDGNQTNRLAL